MRLQIPENDRIWHYHVMLYNPLRLEKQKVLDASDEEFHSVVDGIEKSYPEIINLVHWRDWVESDMVRRASQRRGFDLANTTK